jgi:hypothetical protein
MNNRLSRNVDWAVTEVDGRTPTWERAGIAVLMDIREELQCLTRLFACEHFLTMPQTLRQIARNTRQPKRRRVTKLSRKARS